jgi:fructose-bisphosphate aldolase, class II
VRNKKMKKITAIMKKARDLGIAIPAFNVPYLQMIEPIVNAVSDSDSFALVEAARVEWIKFSAKGPMEIYSEFSKWCKPENVMLHLDHVPVVDEDNKRVDYVSIISKAIDIGYKSVMIDGSRLDLEENINVTRQIVEIAHNAGVVCEAELGAVLGHEAGPLLPYEEIFESGKGFTLVEEAERFAKETRCDWLSVAVGNIHGAISEALRDKKKTAAKLNIEHLSKLSRVTGIPLVLHGGSGITGEYIKKAAKNGITKVNVGTEIRQAYESVLDNTGSVLRAQDAVYNHVSEMIGSYFCTKGRRKELC